jgi:hypothetical protein
MFRFAIFPSDPNKISWYEYRYLGGPTIRGEISSSVTEFMKIIKGDDKAEAELAKEMKKFINRF